MLGNVWRTILHGPKHCQTCGQADLKGQRFCFNCSERLINRNPVLRFFVTIIAMGIVGIACWWTLKK